MSQQQQIVSQVVKFGSASKFQTIISVNEVHAPVGNVELKFETLFSKAKDPNARQKKAQFFLTRDELVNLRDELTEFLSQTR